MPKTRRPPPAIPANEKRPRANCAGPLRRFEPVPYRLFQPQRLINKAPRLFQARNARPSVRLVDGNIARYNHRVGLEQKAPQKIRLLRGQNPASIGRARRLRLVRNMCHVETPSSRRDATFFYPTHALCEHRSLGHAPFSPSAEHAFRALLAEYDMGLGSRGYIRTG